MTPLSLSLSLFLSLSLRYRQLRRLYLRACFWSCHAVYPHIVAAVATREDYDFIAFESGLPFFDVLIYDHPSKGPGVPKPSALGIATVLAAQHALNRRRKPPKELQSAFARDHGVTATSWEEFEFIYYTGTIYIVCAHTRFRRTGRAHRIRPSVTHSQSAAHA